MLLLFLYNLYYLLSTTRTIVKIRGIEPLIFTFSIRRGELYRTSSKTPLLLSALRSARATRVKGNFSSPHESHGFAGAPKMPTIRPREFQPLFCAPFVRSI